MKVYLLVPVKRQAVFRMGIRLKEALNKLTKAESDRFSLSRRFQKPRNAVCISHFWTRTNEEKDPLFSRRRFVQRFYEYYIKFCALFHARFSTDFPKAFGNYAQNKSFYTDTKLPICTKTPPFQAEKTEPAAFKKLPVIGFMQEVGKLLFRGFAELTIENYQL